MELVCNARPNQSSQLASPKLGEEDQNDAILEELKAAEAEEEQVNKLVVCTLYEAINLRDVETVHGLLAPHLEWWFHGPQGCQHMMRLLTGFSPDEPFLFRPLSIDAFGSTVLVEGHGWVHAWTVADGVVTMVREYFNTSLTVISGHSRDGASAAESSSRCQPLWQSSFHSHGGRASVPGLMLAI